MDGPDASLQDRVDALEKAVAELRAELESRPAVGDDLRGNRRRPPPRRKPPRPRKKRSSPSIVLPDDPEVLLRWAGIGLVILAVAFLFKYAVDEGWLTPAIRIVLGGGLGVALIALGGFVYPKRSRFGQVLQGGGIAALYITLFAANQLLDVLDYRVSFAGMVVVTLAGFGLGLYQKDPPLVVLGLLGGLATPFLLYTGQADVSGLLSYTCLLLAATTVIYYSYGWRSVLYTTVIGGWLVFWIAQNPLPHDASIQTGDRWAVQLAIGFGVLAFWCAPVIRDVLRASKPDLVAVRETVSKTGASLERIFENVVYQLIVTTPIIAIALSAEVWDMSETLAGIIVAGAAAVYAAVALLLRSDTVRGIQYAHAVMSGLLATLALVLLIEGDGLLVCLAAEFVGLHLLSRRLGDELLRAGGHGLFVIVAFWMWIRLVDPGQSSPPVVNLSALSELVVLALVVPAAFSLRNQTHMRLYLGLAYAGSLGWLYRELSMLDNGHAFVTVAWSIIGVGLLVHGLRANKDMLRGGGLATLALVIAKLFLVDLAELDPLWRVAVFLGIGAGFLAVGYFLPQVWKPILKRENPEGSEASD